MYLSKKIRMKTIIKNAFVVGIKILGFSNQTMFIGKNLRTMLTIEEFDAVIALKVPHDPFVPEMVFTP